MAALAWLSLLLIQIAVLLIGLRWLREYRDATSRRTQKHDAKDIVQDVQVEIGVGVPNSEDESRGVKPTTPHSTGAERRAHPRRPVVLVAAIAPYVDRRFPAPAEFAEVQCFDISTGGISFFLPSPPTNTNYVAALGSGPGTIHAIVKVVHVKATKLHTLPIYLVGCQFTGRIQPPGESIERGEQHDADRSS
jgi:hypothetical protein